MLRMDKNVGQTPLKDLAQLQLADKGDRATSPHDDRLVQESSTDLDEARRGSIGLVVGLGRRKDNHSYPRPQAEAEDNANHRSRQRSVGYEETACRTHSCADIEKGAPGSNGTTPGACNKGHCIGRRRKNEYGTNLDKVRRDG
jgi:hypothetical protein